MKHFRERSGLAKSACATSSIVPSRAARSRFVAQNRLVARSRFVALAGAMALAGAGSGAARAQVGGSFDNYFMSAGRAFPLAPASNWVGVRVVPNASGALLRGLSSEGALDTERPAQRSASKNIVLVPVKAGASAEQKSALRERIAASSAVSSAARAYIFNGKGDNPLVDTGEVIVRLAGGGADKAVQLATSLGASVEEQVGSYSPNTYVLRVAPNGSGVQLANKLAARGDVVFSQPNFSLQLEKRGTSNDPLYPSQWHLNNTGQGGGTPGADIRAAQAWDITRGSPAITISVQDDGFDLTHEDLVDNMLAGYDFTDGDPDPSPVLDDPNFGDNHGTACAGVAAGAGNNGIGISGAAQACKILPVRMLGRSTDLDTANAFAYSVSRGADVISNSWGFPAGLPTPAVITAAIRNAATTGRRGKGCVILFASGNDGISIDGEESQGVPDISADPFVIAVGATNNFDIHTSYSNTGQALDVVAPSGRGSEGGTLSITTTDRTGDVGYVAGNYNNGFSGTSSACPLVAGVAGLILSSEPELTYSQVRDRLQESADKVDFAGGTYDSSGHSRLYGFGRVNAYRALLGRAPKVTVVTPPDGAALKGIVPVTARTTNDARVQRMVFDQRRVFFSGSNPTVNKAIPDYFVEGVTDTFEVGANLPTRFVQATANVKVRVEHSYVGDLQIALIYNDARGQQVREVIYDHANGGDRVLDLDVPLPLALRPVAGTRYTLQVLDDVQEDTGTFVSWGLTLGSAYTQIGTQEASNHTPDTDWTVSWDTSKLATGTYEVRATAVTNGGATYSDSNGGLKVTGISESSFVLAGRVVDSKGVGVAGVTITNSATKAVVRTNANGEFSFAGLPSGQYVLTAAISGGFFSQVSQTITIESASVTNVRFVLQQRDLVAPVLAVTVPTNGAFVRTLTQVRGTATDVGGTGVVKVTGVLYRAPQSGSIMPSGFFTTAGTFTPRESGAATERVAVGTTKFALIVPSEEGTYRLTVRAYDRAGNITTSVVSYTIDRTLPVVAIATPKNLGLLSSNIVTAAGTARDVGGSGVARVTLRLFRAATATQRGGYYNPTTKTFTATATAANEILATGTERWTLRLPRLDAGRYSLRATATDKAANQGLANAIFTVSVPSAPSA